jgi:hypothetical protein
VYPVSGPRFELGTPMYDTTMAFDSLSLYIKVKLYHSRHAGTKGERRYSSYSFVFSALDRSEWSASRPSRALRPERTPVAIVQEAGWASELLWTQRLQEKPFSSAGDRTSVVQSVVRHYADRATPSSLSLYVLRIISGEGRLWSELSDKECGSAGKNKLEESHPRNGSSAP